MPCLDTTEASVDWVRIVALKLPAQLASHPERIGRFRREAQILAALNHPNIGAAIFATLMFAPAAKAAPPSGEQIGEAAARAVAGVQRSQNAWEAQMKCASCHHQLLPALAFRMARQHGIPVNEKAALAEVRYAFDFNRLDEDIELPHLLPAAGDGYRMVAAEAAGMPPNLSAAIRVRTLLSLQRPEGEWLESSQRPPSSHSRFASAAFALRAIQLYHHPKDAERASQAVARARDWLAGHRAPDTEGRAFQLLGLVWADADPALRRRLARELEAMQQDDGGWGSVEGRASEAYSTGEALYAVHESGGVATTDPKWQGGVEFLLRTQAADGSWHVPSRLHDPARLSPPYFESGYPYGHDQFISVAGACWAVMALAEALPRAVSARVEFPRELVPGGQESWIETVIFGSPADVNRMLEGKFDAKSAKLPEGTTALMMAAPDAAKMRLLIEHGADVKARSGRGYTALAVAARYGGADEAIGLLLDSGAKVGEAEAQVLGIAAHAGNVGSLARLREAGGDPSTQILFAPQIRLSPMTVAVRNGDPAVVRKLLDLGGDVDRAHGEKFSALEGAVLNNNIELVRLFLSRGADVNEIDGVGYTALLLAASIDFGDTEILDLLLASGARTGARNRTGETALDLARKYGHTRFVAKLTKAAELP
jgi:ankyrin repeat protein